ncbi:MAG TPA: lipopolysaccharide biosynthesis protein [Candidatus Binatia bacterium]|nr:lipopolysaccharide biosynthesis protein [Candidatus Binatia bacterium]
MARAVHALGWSIAGQLAVQAIRLAFGVALARLLSPHEFGLLAMVSVLTQSVLSVADLGLEDALVQRRVLDEDDRSSIFWTTLAVGALLGLVTAAAAPAVAGFYDLDALRPLTIMLAALFLLEAIGTVPRALLVRELDFRRTVGCESAGAVAGGVVAVVLAWRGFGVASLAVQALAGAAVESLLLLGAAGWRPRLAFRFGAVRDLLRFGSNRAGTRALGYWSQHVDELLVGKLLGASALGLYGRACTLVRFPVLYVSRATARVMFPALASFQDEPARVRDAYLRATGCVALATVPLCLGLLATAEPFVLGLFGPQWAAMVPLVRILAVASVVQSITTLASSLYLSQGRADLHLRLNVFQTAVMLAATLVGQRWGVTGAAVAYVVGSLVVTVPTLAIAGRLVGLELSDVLARTAPILVAGVAMTVVVVALHATVAADLPPLGALALEAAAGGLVYGAAVHLFRMQPYLDAVAVLRRPAAAGD